MVANAIKTNKAREEGVIAEGCDLLNRVARRKRTEYVTSKETWEIREGERATRV